MKKVAYNAVLMSAIAIFSVQALAQQLYRSVGPDGKVTFSDQPPAPSSNAKVSTGRAGSGALNDGGAAGALPFELRSVVQRFPVTLYTTKDCAPCAAGRNLLKSRGIPFAERTVESNEDIDALKRLAGDTTLPLATVGSQQMKGFSDVEWAQNLDAAGYPQTSQLPSNYRSPAPMPLVARAAPAPTPAPAAAAPAPEPVEAPTANNPAGIRF